MLCFICSIFRYNQCFLPACLNKAIQITCVSSISATDIIHNNNSNTIYLKSNIQTSSIEYKYI